MRQVGPQQCACGCGATIHPKRGLQPGEIRQRGGDYYYVLGHHQRGEKNPRWNGGRSLMVNGYVSVNCPEHPSAYHGRVYEHRLVAEQMLGRLLEPGEVVHHINGVKTDNRPKNLAVFPSHAEHISVERTGKPSPRKGRPNRHRGTS